MTSEQFLTTFQRHLQLSDPRRQDVVAETKQHLSELDPGLDPVVALGKPEVLARHLNRVHIGWGWQWWVPLAVVAAWILLYLLATIGLQIVNGDFQRIIVSNSAAAFWLARDLLGFVASAGLAVYFGTLLPRLHRPRRMFASVTVGIWLAASIAIALSLIESDPISIVSSLVGSALLSLMVVCWLMLIVILSAVRRLPISPTSRPTRWDATLIIGWYLLALFLGYLFIMFVSQAVLIPFDDWLTEQRPAHGSFLLAVNNYFESRDATGWILLSYVGGLTAYTIRQARLRFRKRPVSRI